VEIIYLVEKCRLPMAALDKLMMAFDTQSMALRVAPLDVDTAMFIKQIPRDAVPDMPDRIIAATALRLGLPLVSRDQRMTTAGIEIIW
jgi:predicted nucleic acid-binding protein